MVRERKAAVELPHSEGARWARVLNFARRNSFGVRSRLRGGKSRLFRGRLQNALAYSSDYAKSAMRPLELGFPMDKNSELHYRSCM